MKTKRLILLLSLIVSINATAQRTDSLLRIIAAGNRDIEEAKALNVLAGEYLRSDLTRAKTLLHSAVVLCKTLKEDVQLSAAYTQLVSVFYNMAMMDSAQYYLSRLESLAKQAKKGKESNLISSNYYAAGGLYYKKSGNPKKAIEFFKKSLNVPAAGVNRINIAGQLMNIGNTYNLIGDYKNALIHHLKAMKIFEEEQNKKGQSFTYQNISNSFIMLRQYSKALAYTNKSIALKKELNDTRGLGTAEMALGQIYSGLGKPDLAIQHFDKALEIADNLKLVSELTKIKFNLAKAYLEKKDTLTAIRHFNDSKTLALKISDSTISLSVDMELIALNRKQQSPAVVEKIIETGLDKFDETGQLPKQVTGYQNMATYYESIQRYDKALEFTRKYYEQADSMRSTELQAQIETIEEQYHLDKKEKEIAILKKDQLLQNAKIEKQQITQTGSFVLLGLLALIGILIFNRNRTVQKSRQLLAMEQMRNGIARDLHDDIGSTLTSINILSKVMLQDNSEKDPVQLNNLQKIKEHSSSIMDSMSDIVWTINPHNDTVEKVIYKMKEFTAEVCDPLNIAYTFSIDGDFTQIKLTLEKRKDLYLIFKEAVNNAVKYSCCNQVNIALKCGDGKIQLLVNDNGKGFDEAAVKPGNGLRNIRERAKNMLASLHYNTGIGVGTDINLTIPLT